MNKPDQIIAHLGEAIWRLEALHGTDWSNFNGGWDHYVALREIRLQLAKYYGVSETLTLRDLEPTAKAKLLDEFWNSVGEDVEVDIDGVVFSEFEEIIRVMSDADASGYWKQMTECNYAEGRDMVLELLIEANKK